MTKDEGKKSFGEGGNVHGAPTLGWKGTSRVGLGLLDIENF